MEAATPPRELTGETARRIVDAMRASVAQRGVAGSTFDQVARAAGVSRGLLHDYFGTKERLLGEVVHRDSGIRVARLDAALAPARTAEDLLDALVASLQAMVARDPAHMALVHELHTTARRHPEIAAELAPLLRRRTREHVAGTLAAERDEGVVALRAEPEAVATTPIALADGLALRMLAEPEGDFTEALEAAVACARALLCEP